MKYLLSLIAEFLPNLFRDVAEGKYGEFLQGLYRKAAGKKTITGLVFVGLYGFALVVLNVFGQCVPECASESALAQAQGYVDYLPIVFTFLISVGLIDKSVRLDPPKN